MTVMPIALIRWFRRFGVSTSNAINLDIVRSPCRCSNFYMAEMVRCHKLIKLPYCLDKFRVAALIISQPMSSFNLQSSGSATLSAHNKGIKYLPSNRKMLLGRCFHYEFIRSEITIEGEAEMNPSFLPLFLTWLVPSSLSSQPSPGIRQEV